MMLMTPFFCSVFITYKVVYHKELLVKITNNGKIFFVAIECT